VSTAQHTHLHKLNSFTTDLPCCSSSSSHSATRCARTRRASTPCTLRCCPPIWHTLPPSAVAVRPLTPAHAHSAEIAAAQAFFFFFITTRSIRGLCVRMCARCPHRDRWPLCPDCFREPGPCSLVYSRRWTALLDGAQSVGLASHQHHIIVFAVQMLISPQCDVIAAGVDRSTSGSARPSPSPRPHSCRGTADLLPAYSVLSAD
jgi:hypothetical protein